MGINQVFRRQDNPYEAALEKARAWYGEVEEDVKIILEDIFGDEITTCKVRDFEDAISCLGEGHPLVKAYGKLQECRADDLLSHEIAGLQLRMICTALNDTDVPDEGRRYVPTFSTVKRRGEVCPPTRYLYDHGTYFVYDGYLEVSRDTPLASYSMAYSFKNKDLAEYAGKRFISYWLKYLT